MKVGISGAGAVGYAALTAMVMRGLAPMSRCLTETGRRLVGL